MFRFISCLALLLAAQFARSEPNYGPSDFIGAWTATTDYQANDKVAVRDVLSITFHKDGAFESTLNSIYYLRRTGKEVVWTTFTDQGEWTVEDDKLIFHYKELRLDYLQSDYPSINEASLEQAIQEQLAMPRTHIILSFSDEQFETSVEEMAKFTFRKSNLEIGF